MFVGVELKASLGGKTCYEGKNADDGWDNRELTTKTLAREIGFRGKNFGWVVAIAQYEEMWLERQRQLSVKSSKET